MQRGYIAVGVTLMLLLILGIAGSAFYIGRKSATFSEDKLKTPPPELTTKFPKPSVSIIGESGILVGEKTVSFARVSDVTYLRFKNKMYTPVLDSSKFVGEGMQVLEDSSYKWIGLLDAPMDITSSNFNEVLDFKLLPNKQDFLFTMLWEKQDFKDVNKVKWISDLYYYNGALVNLYSASLEDDKFYIPLADQISSDGKLVSFNMHSCWHCDGGPGQKMLMNIETKESKTIDFVLEFKWEENGKYSYKDYIEETPCNEPIEVCIKDPKTLPVKSGQF